MAMCSAIPSDLFPFVFSFLRENKLLSVAREFTKATGVKDQDPNAASLLDIFNNWLNSSGAKKRKLRSNEPSVTKKKKRDLSSSYDYANEDDEPKVKQPDSSSEECEIKSQSSSKSLHAKAMVKPVPRKPTRPKDVCSSSDEDTESNSSEEETPAKTRTKASASKFLVAKAKSSLTSTKSVNKSLGSNSSLSELKVKKKSKSGKKKQKEPLPCPKQLFMSEKKILAVPTDSSSDLDASIAYKDDICKPAVKHKAVAYGEPPASIAGMSPTVPTTSILPKKGPAGSSSTSDSSSEEEQKPKKAVPAEWVKLNSAKKPKSSCSDSNSDLESKREKKSLMFTSSRRTAAVSSTKKKTTKKDHSNNSSHSEEENSVVERGSASTHRTATLKTKTPEKNEDCSEESSSSEEQVNGKNLKKRKMEVSSGNQNGKERTSDSKAFAQTPNTFLKVKAKKSQSAEPFRRVRDEEIEVDFRVGNNSFDAKRGAKGDWGEKANNVLKFTKGKSFRHEKTKKKRGNYCGGEISTSINSIKFDSE
ncbi:nucleolar and coiled-body phosphoprotein 1 isoform X2 [Lissotriton helveticus]